MFENSFMGVAVGANERPNWTLVSKTCNSTSSTNK